MVGDFGTTSDFHVKKVTDFGDFRLSKNLATFRIASDYRLSIFPGASDYQIFTHPATMKQTRKSPGSETPRFNRTSVLVYYSIHLYRYIVIYISKKIHFILYLICYSTCRKRLVCLLVDLVCNYGSRYRLQPLY